MLPWLFLTPPNPNRTQPRPHSNTKRDDKTQRININRLREPPHLDGVRRLSSRQVVLLHVLQLLRRIRVPGLHRGARGGGGLREELHEPPRHQPHRRLRRAAVGEHNQI